MTAGAWTVRLSRAAALDYRDILRWTEDRFGPAQADTYIRLLAEAFARLERGPGIPGVRQREDIGGGVHTLHVGRRGRHFIAFEIDTRADNTIEVMRILHDAMDLGRHLRPGG